MHGFPTNLNQWINVQLACSTAGSMCLAMMLAGCSKNAIPSTAPEPPTVIGRVAIEQQISDFDEYVGRTEAAAAVNVQARVSGFLQSVEFADGQFVEQDQLLAKIEPDEYEAINQQSAARVELAGARLELAQSELARAKKLVANNASSQEEFEQKVSLAKQAAAEVVVASADAARTALDVKYTEVRAPIDGRIDRAFVTPGNMVTGGLGPGTLLTRIVDLTPIYAYFDIDEASMLRYIRSNVPRAAAVENTTTGTASLRDLNLPCYLQLQDEKDFPHVGGLDFLETQIDKMTGTIRMRAIFENTDRLLQSGMYVRLRIPTSDPYNAVLIPEIAIGTDQSYKYAFVVDSKNQAIRRTLELGEQRGPLRVIKSGIAAGETVIVRGVQRVRPGMQVRVEMQSADQTGDDIAVGSMTGDEAAGAATAAAVKDAAATAAADKDAP